MREEKTATRKEVRDSLVLVTAHVILFHVVSLALIALAAAALNK